MTSTEETEMHTLAEQLEKLTQGTGWEASRYAAIGHTMARLIEYCAVSEVADTTKQDSRGQRGQRV